MLYHVIGRQYALFDRTAITDLFIMGCMHEPKAYKNGALHYLNLFRRSLPDFQFMMLDKNFGIVPTEWPIEIEQAWRLLTPPTPEEVIYKNIIGAMDESLKYIQCGVSMLFGYCIGMKLEVINDYMGEQDIAETRICSAIRLLMGNMAYAAWALNGDISSITNGELNNDSGNNNVDFLLRNNVIFHAWLDRGFPDVQLPQRRRERKAFPLCHSFEEKIDRMRPFRGKYALALRRMAERGYTVPVWFEPIDLELLL